MVKEKPYGKITQQQKKNNDAQDGTSKYGHAGYTITIMEKSKTESSQINKILTEKL